MTRFKWQQEGEGPILQELWRCGLKHDVYRGISRGVSFSLYNLEKWSTDGPESQDGYHNKKGTIFGPDSGTYMVFRLRTHWKKEIWFSVRKDPATYCQVYSIVIPSVLPKGASSHLFRHRSIWRKVNCWTQGLNRQWYSGPKPPLCLPVVWKFRGTKWPPLPRPALSTCTASKEPHDGHFTRPKCITGWTTHSS